MILAPSLKALLEKAIANAIERGDKIVTVEHFIYTMLDEKETGEMLRKCGADLPELRKQIGDYLSADNTTREIDPPQIFEALLISKTPAIVLVENLNRRSDENRIETAARMAQNSAFFEDQYRQLVHLAEEAYLCTKYTNSGTTEVRCSFSGCMERSILRAGIQHASAQQTSIDEGAVLVEIFEESDSAAIRFLETSGLTKLDVLCFISHKLSKLDPPQEIASSTSSGSFFDLFKKYDLILWNDHYTSMEFVVSILKSEFNKSESQANLLMMQVHEQGRAVVGAYPFEIANSKARLVFALAKARNFPLLCTVKIPRS